MYIFFLYLKKKLEERKRKENLFLIKLEKATKKIKIYILITQRNNFFAYRNNVHDTFKYIKF